MTQADWLEYLKLLDNVGKVMGQLTEIEKQKAAAVTRGDLMAVDECMKKEQAMSMSLRGYDQKREAMLAKMELTGVPLRDLERHSPRGLEMETQKTARELRNQYALFQAASQVARNTLELNLHAIELQQAKLEGSGAPPSAPPSQADFRI